MTASASPYVSRADIEQLAGLSYGDFKQACSSMTSVQWASFVDTLADRVSAAINRYCNVDTFFSHKSTDYFDSKGCTGDWFDRDNYRENDRRYYLRQQPLLAGTWYNDNLIRATVYVWVDTAALDTSPCWSRRWERCATMGGDFTINSKFDMAFVRFHSNLPYQGRESVKVVYWAGYAPDSQEIQDIKQIALRAITMNLLMFKKKLQESTTIRASGVRDFAPMFDLGRMTTYELLSDDIKRELDRYRVQITNVENWM